MLSVFVALLAVGFGVMAKLLGDWFTKLNTDSDFQLADFTFEDPNSIKKVPVPSVFSEPSKTLSIVIPAYNEEDRLPATLTETLAYLAKRRDRQGPIFTYEVVIVDDGSKDGTARTAFESVRKYGMDAVRVLRLPRNRGKGYAVKAGLLCCRGEKVLFMDADGATKVSEIERLERRLNEVLASPSEATTSIEQQPVAAAAQQAKQPVHKIPAFILGSRAHLQESAMAKRTWIRNFLMHGFHLLVTLVVGGQIRDTQCGFKLLTRSAAQQIVPNQRLQRWAFDVELVYVAQRLKVPMSEVQVTWTEIPGSKVRMTSIAYIAFELAMIKVGYGIGAWSVAGPQSLKKKN